MFTTERLWLRAFEGAKDTDLLITLWNDEVVAPLVTGYPIIPKGPKFKEIITGLAENALMFCVVEEREGGAFVGLVAFLPPPDARNRKTTLSITLLQPFWNKGYGPEALKFMLSHGFKNLGLHRIALEVHEWNERAIRVYRNLGFIEESREREALWYDGRWRDIIKFGILEHEWVAANRLS